MQAYDSSGPTSARFIGKGTLEIQCNEIPPAVLSALGDAIHNMRAALDSMAAELSRINYKSDKGVSFPFADSKEELQKQIDRKNCEKIIDTRVETADLKLSYRLDGGPISASGSNSHKLLSGPLAGLPLIETLKELVQLVDGIIEEIASMVELRESSNADNDERPIT